MPLPHFNNIDAAKMDWSDPKTILQQYKEKGQDLLYFMDKDRSNIKIKNMTDDDIKYVINDLNQNKTLIFSPWNKDWIEVFNDIIMKRRRLKLNQILKNINNANTNF